MTEEPGDGGALRSEPVPAPQSEPPRKPRWDVIAVIAIAVLACCMLLAFGGGAAWIVWGRVQDGREPTPTATWRVVQVHTATPSATPALPTPTLTPTRAQPARPSATPTTAAPAATPTSGVGPQTPTPAVRATPTPVVCDSIAAMNGIVLAPGQAFRCSIGEQELNAQLAAQPNLPCQSASLTLTDGAIQFTCRVGFALRANVALDAANCRASVRVVGGTPGFTQVVQELIAQYIEMVPYDQVCVERAVVTEEAVTVEGYRR